MDNVQAKSLTEFERALHQCMVRYTHVRLDFPVDPEY